METERMDPRVVFYDYIMKHVGLPYRWGGDDAVDGFDCSGLVLEFLVSCGAFPSGRDTSAQGLHDHFAATAHSAPSFGSLVFFGKVATEISHVGFCMNPLQMIEAGGGGSKTKTLQDAAAQNAYVRLRPIANRKDLIGFVQPAYPWKG